MPLDQVLDSGQRLAVFGGRRQGHLLLDPGQLVLDVSQELVEGEGILQLLASLGVQLRD